MVHRSYFSYLMIGGLSLLLLTSLGINSLSHVQARRVRHVRIQRRAMLKKPHRQLPIKKPVRHRLTKRQHLFNQRKYQNMHKFHLANLRKIQHYQRMHKHHRLEIEHQKINHIKRQKAAKQRFAKAVAWNRNYGFDENYKKDVRTTKPYSNYREVKGNDPVKFNHPIYLNYVKYTGRRNNHGRRYGDPQSMAILPNGHTYVLFNVGHKDSSINRLIEYNIQNGRKIKVGQTFHGGHGQGLTYDYRTHQLWACMNRYYNRNYPRGIIPKVLILAKINQKTLKPTGRWQKIRTKLMMGEDVAYDNNGNYWNVSRNYYKNRRIPIDSLQIFQGHNRRVKLVKDILHSPSACIQNLTYNPDTNRLYVVGNGVIMSFPANRINKLRNRDIRVAVLNHHSEFEGMGFWHRRAYLLVHPDRILRSNKEF